MKKPHIAKPIIGVIFTLISIALISYIISQWNTFKETTINFPLFIGGCVLFGVVGIVCILFHLKDKRLYNKYLKAKESNDAIQIFQIINKIKFQAKKENLLFLVPVPFILLLPVVYILIKSIRQNAANGLIVVLWIMIGFLSFICVGVCCAVISEIFSKNKKAIEIIGDLKSFILSSEIEIYNSEIETKNYRLVIDYEHEGQKFELVTNETYSEEQINILKKLKKIPLKKSGNFVCVNNDMLFNIQQFFYSEEIEIQKGKVSYFGYNKNGSENKAGTKDLKVNIEKIKSREQEAKKNSLGMIVISFVFCVVLCGIGLYSTINGEIRGIFLIIVSLILIYKGVIRSAKSRKIYCKTLQEGKNSYAISYKLKDFSSNRENIKKRVGIKFIYVDENGHQRKGFEKLIDVPVYFFESYKVDRLPIKVFGKYAILDYERIKKYESES